MTDYFLLDNATGSIQAGLDQQDRLDDLTTRLLADEFYVPADSDIPSACIDGRPGAPSGAPNSAGGSESLFVADDLTGGRFKIGTTAEGYGHLLDDMVRRGLPIGGHADEHSDAPKSGCGANDRLGDIYAFIASHGDVLRSLTEALGFTVRDATHKLIIGRAGLRHEFSAGADLLAILRDKAGESVAPVLTGEHKEVVAVINTISGTTLDRRKLANAFGPEYQAFNVDAWAFEAAAMALSPDGTGIPSRIAALAYYNLATAHVLCGSAMRVVVRS